MISKCKRYDLTTINRYVHHEYSIMFLYTENAVKQNQHLLIVLFDE